MPSNFSFKAANAIHRAARTITFGKVGWRGSGMPVLELTTTGRKSGQPRTVQLTSPLQVGDTWIVIGSRGGDDVNPAWVHNIGANPDVEVHTPALGRRKMKARVATAEERADLWPKIVEDHANYGAYQEKTDREIPVVLLEPA